jgi:hypothetical protein
MHGKKRKKQYCFDGGQPPNPRDLSLWCQSRREDQSQREGWAVRSRTARPSVLAPGSALGSVPTVALSSTRVEAKYSTNAM